MDILGIHDGHNASVCHLKDGKISFAIQEERLSREKNHWGTPYKAIQTVLDNSNIPIDGFDSIVFSGRGFFGDTVSKKKFLEDTLEYIGSSNKGVAGTLYSKVVRNLHKKFKSPEKIMAESHRMRIAKFLKRYPQVNKSKVNYVDHHTAHASAAYFGWAKSNNIRVLVMTADGFGDYVSGTVNLVDEDNRWHNLCKITSQDAPHSIAQFYGYVTAAMGFVILEHEYKLMGLAPYANRERSLSICDEFKKLFPLKDGKWRYLGSNPMSVSLMQALKFKRFDEICGGVQMFFEETMVEWIRYWIKKTKIRRICLSGGAFMNVKANMEIMKLPEVEEMFVFPSCGDETNAIGAAYCEHYRLTGQSPFPLKDFYLGRKWSSEKIEIAVKEFKASSNIPIEVKYVQDISKEVAERLSEGEVVATCWGREEFGARALGNRSILADPRNPRVVDLINNMIKKRDFWMPFACAVLPEEKDRYIKDYGKIKAQYMIMAFPGGPEVDQVYAGSHPKDRSIRPQVIERESNPLFYDTIKTFKKLTGAGAVLNTSFNLHGYPLVGSPCEALEVFGESGLQILAFENFIISKITK